MDFNKKDYKKFADARAKPSPTAKNCVLAFLVGGFICTLAQALTAGLTALGLDRDTAGALSSICLVFLAAVLTGLGVFDRIAKHAGAGTLVPITGFANAVVSPAIDARSEGLVLGVGANMFKIAGPVIVYGTLAGAIYGVIYWFIGLF